MASFAITVVVSLDGPDGKLTPTVKNERKEMLNK